MNKMSYTLNPCKACWEKYKRGGCDINTINSCVVETAAAFAGVPSNNAIAGTSANANWEECMEKMMKSIGRTKCDLRLDMAPVFNQAPHYFPAIFAETGNAKKSQRSCMQRCSELRHNKKQCIENCVTDQAAVKVKKSSKNDEDRKGLSNFYVRSTNLSFNFAATIALILCIALIVAVVCFLLLRN